MNMKFAIINDAHLGPADSGFKKGIRRKLVNQSKTILESIIKTLNQVEKPKFVVNLGDSIEDVNNRAIDLQSFKKFLGLVAPLTMPAYHLIGNHDVRTLTETEIAKLLGYKKMYYSFDLEQYHFIVLSFQLIGDHTHIKSDIRAIVPTEQIDWLKIDLNQTNKPTLVFTHYGLAEDDMKGNFWFETSPHFALFNNRNVVKKILEQSGKIKAVFNAHQHWNRMHVENNIPYFTLTSMSENFRNDGVPTKAYTIVNLDQDKISVEVNGNDPAQWEFNFPAPEVIRSHFP